MIKILIVDDHKLVRDGIRIQLVNHPDFQILSEASDGQEALEILKELKPDVVIMDVNMDGMDGIECTRQISKLYPSVKVLGLTMLGDKQYIKQMLKAGASGYLLKNCEDQELINAVKAIYNDGTYYSPEVTRIIMSSFSNNKERVKSNQSSTVIPFSQREKEVLRLILKEYSNAEIAKELFISPRTVDAHKRNLLEKTGSRNIAGLVLYTLNHQIFDDL